MSMTTLAVDIGNSNTVLGLYRNHDLLSDWRLETDPAIPAATLREHIRLFCREAGISPETVDAAGIASVVPSLTKRMAACLRNLCRLTPVVISGQRNSPLRLRYGDPASLGADRLCAIVAAWERYGGPAIIADLGSATTIDALSRKGEYLGGIIAPGVGMQIDALARRTAQLPPVPLFFPPSVIGRTTVECIQSGVLYGAVELIEGMVRRMELSVGGDPVVIATGGYARLIAQESLCITVVDPWLVLDGIRIITMAAKGRKRTGRSARAHTRGRTI